MSTREQEDREEQDYDDSDQEKILIRNGRVDPRWYATLPHKGYDINLNQVAKGPDPNKLEELIKRSEDPNWWRTIRDEANNCDVVLTDQQLDLIERIRKHRVASKAIAQKQYTLSFPKDDPFPVLTDIPAKRRFQPSKWQRMKVNKIIRLIKEGKLKPQTVLGPKPLEDLWAIPAEDQLLDRPAPVNAPKMKLPDNFQSYNPPAQYLWSKEEEKEWQEQHPQDRRLQFLPRKYNNTRSIQLYDQLINERYQRCLDLFLCPRIKKKRIQVDLQSILPEMPRPQQFRPFPTQPNIIYKGHQNRVRSSVASQDGNLLISGDDQGWLITWDVLTSRKKRTVKLEGIIFSIDSSKGLVVVGHGNKVSLVLLNTGERHQDELQNRLKLGKANNKSARWVFTEPDTAEYKAGLRLQISFQYEVTHVRLHQKGDYFLTVSPQNPKKSEKILVYCISKGSSQGPFAKSKGILEKAFFHPSKPLLIVMTRKSAFIYNLQKQMIHHRFFSGADWNSSLAIHPYGDILVISSFEGKLVWLDMELSQKPFKIINLEGKTIRKLTFHLSYPLFAACCDDGSIHLYFVRVMRDSPDEPLIVPLRILSGGHRTTAGLGVLDIQFHPKQPWLFSTGADGKVCLWT